MMVMTGAMMRSLLFLQLSHRCNWAVTGAPFNQGEPKAPPSRLLRSNNRMSRSIWVIVIMENCRRLLFDSCPQA